MIEIVHFLGFRVFWENICTSCHLEVLIFILKQLWIGRKRPPLLKIAKHTYAYLMMGSVNDYAFWWKKGH